jgi:hypothetical protein
MERVLSTEGNIGGKEVGDGSLETGTEYGDFPVEVNKLSLDVWQRASKVVAAVMRHLWMYKEWPMGVPNKVVPWVRTLLGWRRAMAA